MNWSSPKLLCGPADRLLNEVHYSGYSLAPILPRDLDLGLIDRQSALASYEATSWARVVDAAPTLFLCRYEDATSRAQPAWVARAATEEAVPLPWYFGLEGQSRVPAPPWEITVVINAFNGIRILDRVRGLRA